MGSAQTRQGDDLPGPAYLKDSVPTNPPLSAKQSFLTLQSCLNRSRFEAEDKRPRRRRGAYKKPGR
uniref:Uncharacterized protein n=1 Tax=Magnetococcus massalia (strain MO-1) TaxID=451514 RepID=A0A1S7LGD9_MAGMO|nr:protein of unknown function [Candidatus Magnetococcus massalia]